MLTMIESLTIRHIVRVALVVLVLLGIGTGCSGRGANSAGRPDYTALFVPAHDDPFFHALERGAREEADRRGITLLATEYPQVWDTDLQLSLLESALTDEIDLIIIAPTSQTEITDEIREIAERGYDIVTVDTYFGNGDYRTGSPRFPMMHVGTDNQSGGNAIAEYVADLVGKQGRVYITTTLSDVSSVEDRLAGFEQRVSAFPNMQIVRIDYNDDRQDIAYEQTLTALQDHPEITVIFAANVFSSAGAYQALLDTGMTGAIRIASWDSTRAMEQALRKGHVDVILAQKPAEMGQKAIALWADSQYGQGVPEATVATDFVIFTQENFREKRIDDYVY